MVLKFPDGRTSSILIGESIENLSDYLKSERVFILTNQVIFDLYSKFFPENAEVIVMPSGEDHKNLNTVAEVVRQLIAAGADRKSFITGFGGGIVCDIAGFIASIYMRGLRFGFVPTTLMAQVDASIGGKNGVNFDRYKNMVGAFSQPEFVLCDPKTLKTLPERELIAGMAEVIKYGLIADSSFFDYIENNLKSALCCEERAIREIVSKSVAIKAKIVAADEKESGERRKLNLGHTFGHAVEKLTDAGLLHGEALGAGLTIAAKISLLLNMITAEDYRRILNVISAAHLPTGTLIPCSDLMDAIKKDKKKENSTIHLVLNRGIGDSEVREMDFNDLSHLLKKAMDD
ncbi:MAG: 3-dehydroquinate synthase [Prevotellaceae bacterium]|jgi:3-dehydroquinate synthase|nr:3-dehydroquinate synthase [Prevotellaceae bacterium]